KVFNEKVVTTVSGQQLPRTSWEKIQNIKIALPNESEQQKIISRIEQYEKEIQKAGQIIEQTAERKKSVLSKYL
ncbi:restriction endonuclease subunit S, partial [Moraxella boevrei]|uniref:restriction endonuclease subunit S n=1 Tax=Faucicola boevrei TaxID=346665 RepID=UPI0037364458